MSDYNDQMDRYDEMQGHIDERRMRGHLRPQITKPHEKGMYEETTGTKAAREIRAEANNWTPEHRAEMQKKGMEMINAQPPATDEKLDKIVDKAYKDFYHRSDVKFHPVIRQALLDYTAQLREDHQQVCNACENQGEIIAQLRSEIVELAELNRNAVAGIDSLKQ